MSKKFKVQGIPTLVFIEAETGKLVTSKGREGVGSDPSGKEFPWHPKPFSEIISGELLRGEDTVQSDEALSGKVKGFYFSAHWVNPFVVDVEQLSVKVYVLSCTWSFPAMVNKIIMIDIMEHGF